MRKRKRLRLLKKKQEEMQLGRDFDHLESQLESLKERATGPEKIRCINDLFWLRSKRTMAGV